jgi:ketosteroid isomerase-like protein
VATKNVEFVRRIAAEWERGSFPAEVFAEDVRIVWLEGVGVSPETNGLDEARREIGNWLQNFDHAVLAIEEIIDAGGAHVVTIGVWRARGRASGVETTWRHGQIWTIRDGKVTELVSYTDPDEALAAAGVVR